MLSSFIVKRCLKYNKCSPQRCFMPFKFYSSKGGRNKKESNPRDGEDPDVINATTPKIPPIHIPIGRSPPPDPTRILPSFSDFANVPFGLVMNEIVDDPNDPMEQDLKGEFKVKNYTVNFGPQHP